MVVRDFTVRPECLRYFNCQRKLAKWVGVMRKYHDTEIASAVVPGGDGLDVSKGFFNRTFFPVLSINKIKFY